MDTKKLRQKILDLAIRGKLVPQDPNDEPASVLLERIRAEKERLIKEGKIKRSKKSADTPNDENEAPFEIPQSWEWVRLGTLCNVVRGGSPRPAGSKEFYEGPIPFLKVADLTRDDGIYVNKAQSSIKEAGLTKTRLIGANTLLLTNSGATLGVPKINTFETTINDGIAAFINISSDIQMFIYWYLKSKTNSFRQIDQGAAQPNLNTDILSAEIIPLPPLAEQQRIVSAIEQWFAVIDILENAKDDLQTSIARAKSKILDLAIRGKLVPQDPNNEPAIELLKRINPEFKPCDNAGFEIPSNWEWTTIGEIASSIRYGVSESAKELGKYKLLRITDIQDNKVDWNTVPFTDFDENKASSYILQDGDILFARTGATVGKSYLVKGISQPSIYASYLIRVQTSVALLPQYIKCFFESGFYWKQISLNSVGIGQPNVNGTTLANLIVPIPPYPEQQRIVAKIEELFTALDNIKESIEV